ncbi:purine-nucleoside phosphorylase [Noviherbaspirillum pedocola]|uniref:Purine nucleoside permease n=1 Tax=Noviherbaspirillum pedocola TaxID=2801341 RepID=A0A934SUL6_9BURK|nr:purine nucleoside permease [Noviherbaspirillum pedocola]MBK4735471.1 purine nucleoside permease [Noviherbaspirillum pedocola]
MRKIPGPRGRLIPAYLKLACALGVACYAGAGAQSPAPRQVKVLIISMFAPEAQPWIDKMALTQAITVPGLSATYPQVRCNAADVCQVTTDMGKANAASTMSALVYSRQFDFSRTWFLVAGVGGVDPRKGTLGSAAWSRWLVDWDLSWEIDARDKPAAWPTGYLGINTDAPGRKPPPDYGSEVFRLDEALLQKALALSKTAQLADSAQAQAYRARYGSAPANAPPAIMQCDSLTGNNWWHGELLGQRARDWVRLLTDDAGDYCMTAQEDNATYKALQRGAQAGRLDIARVAVLRTAANFDRPYPGQTPLQSIQADSGGFAPAVANLVAAGRPLVDDIVANWEAWKDGVPAVR